MGQKIKDFIQLSLFGFVIFTFILVILQVLTNFFTYVICGELILLEINLRFFVSFEVLNIIVSLLLGIIYVFSFKKYKKNEKKK